MGYEEHSDEEKKRQGICPKEPSEKIKPVIKNRGSTPCNRFAAVGKLMLYGEEKTF